MEPNLCWAVYNKENRLVGFIAGTTLKEAMTKADLYMKDEEVVHASLVSPEYIRGYREGLRSGLASRNGKTPVDPNMRFILETEVSNIP